MKINTSILLAAFRTYFRNIQGRKFEPEIIFLKNILNEGDNCFHIGASDARHSYVMSKLIGGKGQIYAFEPSSHSFSHLIMMTKMHRIKNIHTYNLAVSDKAGTVCLVTPIKSTGHAGRSFAYMTEIEKSDIKRKDIKAVKFIKEEVKSIAVDDFVLSNNINKVDFIRCDTEGSEMLILKGAAKTIEKYKPNLLLEIHSDALKDVFNSNASEVSSFLFGIGYHMFREDGGVIHQVEEVNENERWKDYFFIHPDRINSLPDGPFRNLLF